MKLIMRILAVMGALLSLAAGLWLIFGFSAKNPRYQVIRGGGYTQSDPVGLKELMRDQSKAAGVATLGASFQFIAVMLALIYEWSGAIRPSL